MVVTGDSVVVVVIVVGASVVEMLMLEVVVGGSVVVVWSLQKHNREKASEKGRLLKQGIPTCAMSDLQWLSQGLQLK